MSPVTKLQSWPRLCMNQGLQHPQTPSVPYPHKTSFSISCLLFLCVLSPLSHEVRDTAFRSSRLPSLRLWNQRNSGEYWSAFVTKDQRETLTDLPWIPCLPGWLMAPSFTPPGFTQTSVPLFLSPFLATPCKIVLLNPSPNPYFPLACFFFFFHSTYHLLTYNFLIGCLLSGFCLCIASSMRQRLLSVLFITTIPVSTTAPGIQGLNEYLLME